MHIWLVLGLLGCSACGTGHGAGWPFASQNRINKVTPAATEPDQGHAAHLQTHHQPHARLAHSGVTAVVFHQVSWMAAAFLHLSLVCQAMPYGSYEA